MNTISNHIKAITNTQPLFVFSIKEDDDQRLRVNAANRVHPEPETNDPIEKIVCEQFSERMTDNGTFITDTPYTYEKVLYKMREQIRPVVKMTCHFDKEFKDLDYMLMSHFFLYYSSHIELEQHTHLISLYRYVVEHFKDAQFNGCDFLPNEITEERKQHADNVLKILKLMKEKYDPDRQPNQSRRRRRRY